MGGTVVRQETLGGVAVLTLSNPPVNALGHGLRAAIDSALEAALANASVRAVVLAAEGKVFVGGADISEFGTPPRAPLLPDVLDRLDGAGKPVVAAIHGAALGGGLELALACHARVVGPKAKLGLPEVKLGLIPGAGGTQRLPRLVGPESAFAMMLSGEPVDAKKAVAMGLADALETGDLVEAARTHALKLAEGGAPVRVRDRGERLDPATRAGFETKANEAVKKAPGQPNVAALADVVRAGFDLPFEEAVKTERTRFLALVDDPRSKALRYAFFAERETARVPGLSKETPRREIASAAVIGAGTMGGGIALCFANAGIPVIVIETEQEALDRGLARMRATYASSVKRGSLSEAAMEERLSRITGAVGLDNAAQADIVVEAAFEEMGIKETIFSALSRIAKPGAILATNTSYLDIDRIADATDRPGDVLGLHFFSPANVMRLVEVVRAARTAPDALATGNDLARRLGKLPVTVGVCFGFVGNRMLARRSAAGERLLLAGALPHEVDAAVTEFGFRMGPFAMSDLAGLDIGWRTRKATGGKAPVADALCEAGRLGQKTGKGFYLYPEGARTGSRDPEVEALIERTSAEHGTTRRSFSPDEIVARLMLPMANEGARILEEGIAARPGDIDTIWLNGYNWPAWRGGPMHWADSLGLAAVAADLDRFAEESGDETLRPAPLLARLAQEGKRFSDWGGR
ncbi:MULTISPECIES: 3-hydroxyacyl-CoA dehydrogenase NAD-binding domain-containing protein [Methylobacterium]|nr:MULTISPECIES: 3-hydroxyacyl-CoA dehydrogenase NAD-binding domain-containing protein [Methylobacterium]MBN6823589.1 enoyl-CoA hydratase/isomerase family protein [Methylobacterium organophilum]MBY0252493.1 enoyl-CoA hydratase/isomerase family protein [Methylobacterium organophilum]MCX7336120.1 3-hydroxyacyl-CoA dehydrogenase NAD-binding domain-containing protein [Hyphomicrobiales bacterium]